MLRMLQGFLLKSSYFHLFGYQSDMFWAVRLTNGCARHTLTVTEGCVFRWGQGAGLAGEAVVSVGLAKVASSKTKGS